MVDLLMMGESRKSKLRRDFRKMRRLFDQGRAQLQESGGWKGSPQTRLLALIDWYHDNTPCRVCRDTPEHSFSHTVQRMTGRRGAAAGLGVFAALWAWRTLAPARSAAT